MKYKFKSEKEYLNWCHEKVNRIKLGLICMREDIIKEVISEIDSKLHLPEGCELYDEEEEVDDLRCHFVVEDPRYPILCVNGKFNYGLDFNPETGEIGKERQCICHSRSDNECICDLDL